MTMMRECKYSIFIRAESKPMKERGFNLSFQFPNCPLLVYGFMEIEL